MCDNPYGVISPTGKNTPYGVIFTPYAQVVHEKNTPYGVFRTKKIPPMGLFFVDAHNPYGVFTEKNTPYGGFTLKKIPPMEVFFLDHDTAAAFIFKQIH